MANLDISSLMGMLSGDGISALGKSADAKSSQVSGVLDSALPLLLSGMKDNASTKAGAASLNKALKDHAKDDTADIGSFLQNVDLADGGKILTHILGDNKKTAVDGIAKKNGISSDQVTTILSSLAPLLLTKLGSSKADEDDDDGAGLTDLLGSLLSGGTSTKKKSSSKKNSSASALGNLLGSLLGSSSDEDEEEEEEEEEKSSSGLDLGGLASLAMNIFGDSEALEEKESTKKSSTKKTSTKSSTTKKTSSASSTSSTKKASTTSSSAKKASSANTSSAKSSTTKSGKKVVRVNKDN